MNLRIDVTDGNKDQVHLNSPSKSCYRSFIGSQDYWDLSHTQWEMVLEISLSLGEEYIDNRANKPEFSMPYQHSCSLHIPADC